MAEDSDGDQLKPSSTDACILQNGHCLMQRNDKRQPRCRGRTSNGIGSYCKRRSLKQHGCDDVTTVMTCEGDINDPQFHDRFQYLMAQLKMILMQDREDCLKVKKIEPWNSVRVTLTIPREAAQRLRTLAAAGDAALQALGILSVQVEGDQVISLRLTARFGGEPQEILLTTGSNGDSNSSSSVSQVLSTALGGCQPGTSSGTFRSPNVVAPGGVGIPPSPKMAPPSGPSPYPFTSMTHAAQAQQNRDSLNNHHNFTPPPPYPVKASFPQTPSTTSASNSNSLNQLAKNRQQNTVTSSPLLVNLLQNDGTSVASSSSMPPPVQADKLKGIRKLSPPGVEDTVNKQVPPLAQPLDGVVNKPLVPPSIQPQRVSPVVAPNSTIVSSPVRQRNPAHMKNCNMTVQQQQQQQPIGMPPVANLNLIRNRFNGPSPSVKTFQQNQPQPIVSARPSSVQRYPQIRPSSDVRPVIQGYSQFTAATSKPSTSSNETTEVKSDGVDTSNEKKLIINPLTGELEPMPSESSESETEDQAMKEDPFLYSPSPGSRIFSDDDSNNASRHVDGSDHSDNELGLSSTSGRRRNTNIAKHGQEKIKLRLKLEKCEPVTQSYKVDVSFVNSPTPRKALPVSGNRAVNSSSLSSSMSSNNLSSHLTGVPVPTTQPGVLPSNEEPRVPPLHISLRGRNAAVVKPPHWGDDEDHGASSPVHHQPTTLDFHKVNRKKVRTGREEFAIGFKKTKIKSDVLKLKIPSSSLDDVMRVKRKESKKLKLKQQQQQQQQQQQHMLVSSASVSEDEVVPHLKMDSEEFISRTLKEGINFEKRNKLFGDEESDEERTMKDRLKKLNLKIKNEFKEVSGVSDAAERECDEVETIAKKPQEIGGKIKSELSSKIDRVSGKLKNDLSLKISKDSFCKKLKDDKLGAVRNKLIKKEDGEEGFAKGRRRHSGDSVTESQAQKVKNRSSSSDQISTGAAGNPSTPAMKTAIQSTMRRLDTFARRRKDSVIDRLRKDKLKVFALSRKLSQDQSHNKRVHANNVITVKPTTLEVQNNNSPVKEITNLEEVTKVKEEEPVGQAAGGESPANQGNTQGEDSGIESMDALSEKSPNQGESPCRSERKEEESQKELDISKPEEKKGQNHDRTEETEPEEGGAKSCLNEVEEKSDSVTTTLTEIPITTSATTTCTTQAVVVPSESGVDGEYPLDKRLTESFESKIREAFLADVAQEGLAAKILDTAKEADCDEVLDRFRVNPPLYTYAKREDSLSPSPTNVDCAESRLDMKSAETLDEDSNTSSVSIKKQQRSRRKAEGPSDIDEASNTSSETTSVKAHRGNKSLLEQLLIEIPADESRRTRSWHRLGNSPGGTTPKSSPRSLKDEPRPSPTGSNNGTSNNKGKRKFLASENEDNHRPNKRKCSENAAELIKACMGLDDKKQVPNSKISISKKGGEIESSDDEPLIDLAGKPRSREPSVEKTPTTKTKTKPEDENKNGKLTSVASTVTKPTPTTQSTPSQQTTTQLSSSLTNKTTEVATRRSVRQNNNGTNVKQDVRNLRSTRNTPADSDVSKRRRTSRDGK